MGFMATIKAQQAMRAHGKGDLEQAKKLYEEAIDKGLMSARPMLGDASLLTREGSYDKAMPLLIKAQKCPDLTPYQKSQLFVDYAACLMKKGELDKAIHLLEKQHNRAPIGLTYQTLGYMYIEKYSGAKPVAEAAPEKAAEAPEMPDTEASTEAAEEQPKVKTQEDIGSRGHTRRRIRRLTRCGSYRAMIWKRATRQRRLQSWKRHWTGASPR